MIFSPSGVPAHTSSGFAGRIKGVLVPIKADVAALCHAPLGTSIVPLR